MNHPLRQHSLNPIGQIDLLAHTALFVVALIYGANYFIAKELFHWLAPMGVVGLRTAGAALIFGAVGYARGWLELPANRSDWIRLLACTFFGAVINQHFFLGGLSRTLEVNASVIMTTSPVFVVIVAVILRQESISAMRIAGLVLALSGAVVLSLNGRDLQVGENTLTGDLMILGNACSYGIYLVLVHPLMKRYHVFSVMAWLFGLATLVNLPIGMPDILAADWPAMPASAILSVGYLIIAVTFLSYALNAFALKRVPSSHVGIYIYLQPVVVSVLAAFLPDKTITPMQLFCMVLVCAGVALVAYRKKRR